MTLEEILFLRFQFVMHLSPKLSHVMKGLESTSSNQRRLKLHFVVAHGQCTLGARVIFFFIFLCANPAVIFFIKMILARKGEAF